MLGRIFDGFACVCLCACAKGTAVSWIVSIAPHRFATPPVFETSISTLLILFRLQLVSLEK